MNLSQRASRIKPFLAMEMLEKAQALRAQGENIISLSIGEPDFPAPSCVKEACIEAIEQNFTRYTHSQGLVELREAIAHHYQNRYRVEVHPEQVFITTGTSSAFLLIFSTLLNRGDSVLLPELHYPCYSNFIQFFDGQVLSIPVIPEERFQPDLERIPPKILHSAKAILLGSPANPTGYLISKEIYQKLAEQNFYLISDEIYHGLVYEGEEHTALEFTDRCFVVNGFSKAYSMTGFRLGYCIAPKEFIRPMQIVHQNFYISVNAFVQRAGIAALEKGGNAQAQMRDAFLKRREIAFEELKRFRLAPPYQPDGAFYFFIDLRQKIQDSYGFAVDCLEKAKVALTPGIDFGEAGEGYLRISYANSEENIREGIRRFGSYWESL